MFPKSQSSPATQLLGLAGWILGSCAAGLIGAIASVQARSFYGQLIRPSWAPPGWLFAPVWSVLYVLLGLAAWIVWRSDGFRANRTALMLFIIQLAANALWTWLFFAWREGALAFAEILVLWVLIVATSASFWRRSALAGALLLPYLAWVTFASALTYAVWRLNPNLL
ncbi:MAG: TspO/MBR family protein [Pseudomonadota bacterium]